MNSSMSHYEQQHLTLSPMAEVEIYQYAKKCSFLEISTK